MFLSSIWQVNLCNLAEQIAQYKKWNIITPDPVAEYFNLFEMIGRLFPICPGQAQP